MEIIVIIQKLDKHGDKIPIVYLNREEGRKRWEEIKFKFATDEDAKRYYDCEIWEGDPEELNMIDHFQGYYA